MRITEDSAQRLVLKGRTAWLSFLLWGAGLLVLFLAHDRLGPSHAWVVPLAMGLFGLALLRASTVTLDRVTGTVGLTELDVFKRRNFRWRFDEIHGVEVQGIAGPHDGQPSYRLVFDTTAGTVPLTSVYGPGEEHHEAMRRRVLEVLGKAADGPRPDPVRQLLAQGRKIDAIQLLRQRESLDLATATDRVDAMEKESG